MHISSQLWISFRKPSWDGGTSGEITFTRGKRESQDGRVGRVCGTLGLFLLPRPAPPLSPSLALPGLRLKEFFFNSTELSPSLPCEGRQPPLVSSFFIFLGERENWVVFSTRYSSVRNCPILHSPAGGGGGGCLQIFTISGLSLSHCGQ